MGKILLFFSFLILLTSCGTVNNVLTEKSKTIEYYRIYDIKTDVKFKDITKAASNGLGRNTTGAHEATPIPSFPPSNPPEKPGRFKLENPLKGSNFSAFAGQAGSLGLKIATCDESIWNAQASKSAEGSFNLKLTACLFRYKEGYHLDLYANFNKKEGGLMEISRKMASAMVGTPEQWVEKTFNDIIRQIYTDTQAKIELKESFPEVTDLPWVDKKIH